MSACEIDATIAVGSCTKPGGGQPRQEEGDTVAKFGVVFPTNISPSQPNPPGRQLHHLFLAVDVGTLHQYLPLKTQSIAFQDFDFEIVGLFLLFLDCLEKA